MASMNISLPEPLREWVEAQIRRGLYGNASEYLRDLIRRDQER
jgi:antitoxin ParD1/3/4